MVRRYLLEKEGAKERVIYPEEIPDFEECFVTNSLMGIMPVNSLAGHLFAGRKQTEVLRTRYQKYLQRAE
ncbi:MAG: aminotransferase class IV [Lachnospiraceae bacterium]